MRRHQRRNVALATTSQSKSATSATAALATAAFSTVAGAALATAAFSTVAGANAAAAIAATVASAAAQPRAAPSVLFFCPPSRHRRRLMEPNASLLVRSKRIPKLQGSFVEQPGRNVPELQGRVPR